MPLVVSSEGLFSTGVLPILILKGFSTFAFRSSTALLIEVTDSTSDADATVISSASTLIDSVFSLMCWVKFVTALSISSKFWASEARTSDGEEPTSDWLLLAACLSKALRFHSSLDFSATDIFSGAGTSFGSTALEASFSASALLRAASAIASCSCFCFFKDSEYFAWILNIFSS